MDLPIRPKPSNAHKPRVRLPATESRYPVYNVRVPLFKITLTGGWFVRFESVGYLAVDAKYYLDDAMRSAIEHAKFLRCCGGNTP